MTAVPAHDHWTQTYSGCALDLVNPQADCIVLDDVVRGLCRTPRFNGQTTHFYSVAQHSLLVVAILRAWGASPKELQAGLMHDAPEAYLGDIARPVKRLIPQYRDIEGRVWSAVSQRFFLPFFLPDIVKKADDLALRAEAHALLPFCVNDWAGEAVELPSAEAEHLLVTTWARERLLRVRFVEEWDAIGGGA